MALSDNNADTRMERSRQLRRRDFSTLSEWERFEMLSMLPDPENPRDDGSGLAQEFFLLTQTGFDLDSLLLVVNDVVRAYLLENGYVIELPATNGSHRSPRYSWGDMANEWDQCFES